ncbi:unnamed protein product, partial [Ixodes persulcatus]
IRYFTTTYQYFTILKEIIIFITFPRLFVFQASGAYNFAYGDDQGIGPWHRESGDASGNKAGTYGLKDSDGRFRTVNYAAGAGGFTAGVHTNEPGVDGAQSPADVSVSKSPEPAGLAHGVVPGQPGLLGAPVLVPTYPEYPGAGVPVSTGYGTFDNASDGNHYIFEPSVHAEAGHTVRWKESYNMYYASSGSYNFGYAGTAGGGFHTESGDSNGFKKGSYGLNSPDGQLRTVHYVADAGGFRANVQSNEPGVDSSKNPADVNFGSPAVPAVAPPQGPWTAHSSGPWAPPSNPRPGSFFYKTQVLGPQQSFFNASIIFHSFQVHGNYDFGYEEKHTSGGSFRQESGDAYGRKYGSYGLTDADGRVRIVKYVADEHGFRATITTNEPGTAPSTPAGVAINVPQEPTVPVPVAPPPQKVIPVATTFQATPVGPPPVISAPVVSAPVVSTPVLSAPVGPTHFLSGPAAPAPVATYAAAPAVTTFKRFLPATGPAYSYSAAPVFQPGHAFSSVSAGPAFSSVSAGPAFSSVSTGPAFSSFATGPAFGRRVVVRTVPAAAFSSGFVPTLPYSGASKVVVRKAVLPSPGYYGGGELLKSASYTPTTVVAPAYGTKLSGPSFSYAAAASSVVPSAVATVDPWPKSSAAAVDPWPKTGAIAAEPWGKSAVTVEDPWPKSGATAAEPITLTRVARVSYRRKGYPHEGHEGYSHEGHPHKGYESYPHEGYPREGHPRGHVTPPLRSRDLRQSPIPQYPSILLLKSCALIRRTPRISCRSSLDTGPKMKVIILLAALAVAHAGFIGHAGLGYGHAAESGHSSQHRSQDLKGNYNFGYKESHTSGGSFRQESGDAWGNKVGSFGLTDADGRVRVVKYVADGHGFRAHIATNEPGTAASHPAAASFSAPHKVPAIGLGVAKVAVAAAHPVASYAVAPVAYGHGYGH